MKIRRFFGKDMREALSQVKNELGSDAVIMSNRKVADGIELVAAYDKEPVAKLSVPPKPKAPVAKQSEGGLPTLSEIIGDDGPDTLRALLEKQAEQKAAVAQRVEAANAEAEKRAPAKPAPEVAPAKPETPLFDAENEEAELSGGGSLADIRAEIASLRNVLQFQLADMQQQQHSRLKPQQRYLLQQLCDMGISQSLAAQLVTYTPAECNEREAWLYLLKLLSNRLTTNNDDILTQQGVVALVGPTGTGKTTTIAKLAARYAQKYGADQVALITIDTYRIAAYEQLATYGKIIGCPVRKAQSGEQLADLLFQLRNKRLVLIDTAGFSQRDSRLISQLATFGQVSGQQVKNYLVVQGNTQQATLKHIINAYKSIDLQGCIITKLDECYSLGEVISNVIEAQLPVSYVADGQQVPEDIHVANAKSIISLAAKLYKKYGLNHTNSSSDVNTAQAV
ncbi:flagellar biosynthesis protein FlhF [Alteromonas alba]|uniref:Flagellar biosynthesis protein FlhF n=1 Tax=Alteromonas alba TaxID=2079529 RepID=A0A2S9VEV6_9ALTE|nr:flagellar biosynthesis protein FlhF [Alteromonas alba]PRO74825.1 flagellar biosynthesis protein FlhF [Alteromonas alba]|tara:strand:- start:22546 stop:23901 length:1356 start_codon:yes stop_codon:yes gene_type:complete